MPFKFIGKNKLLRTLKMQMSNPHISYADILYFREELSNQYKKEMVVYIENNTHYRVRHQYLKDEQKITMYYEIIKQVAPNNFKVEQKNLLKESENN